ncbi:MAG: SURF1 family protein [Congregibacter sp.]
MSKLVLDLEWRTTLLTALLVPTLVLLGFWQLERADEKVAIAAQNTLRESASPLPLAALLPMADTELAYRQVIVSGYFLADSVILLDNQIRDGRYGHDVYSLFLDEQSAQLVLLNRGWVPGDPSRRSVPDVTVPTQRQTLQATIYVSPGEPYLLAEEQFDTLRWPLLVQSATTAPLRSAIEAQFDKPVFAAELRLLPDQAGGYRRDWPLINVSPQKHQGYAVQWFTMAAALLLFFALRSSNLMALLRGKKTADSG